MIDSSAILPDPISLSYKIQMSNKINMIKAKAPPPIRMSCPPRPKTGLPVRRWTGMVGNDITPARREKFSGQQLFNARAGICREQGALGS